MNDNSSVSLYFGEKEPTKRARQSDIFTLLIDWVKIHQFPLSCLKLQVSFSLNFALLFSVMRDNSSVRF